MSKIKVDRLETLDGSTTVNVADLASAGSGITDHGGLTGLADDDHPQYLNRSRGDARYSQLGHGHTVSDVAGLQTALDGKAASSHVHAISDVTGLQSALDGNLGAATAATESGPGIVQLATAAEAQALASTTVALTPARLADAFRGANQSLSASGFQRLPGGLIIQWGSAVATNFTTATAAGTGLSVHQGQFSATFPIAFNTAVLYQGAHCAISPQNGTWGTATVFVPHSSLTTIYGPVLAMFNPNGSMTVRWIAIGY